MVSKIPSRTVKLETIFEKSHRTSVILKIVGATPQLVQNLTPIRKLFCTFLYLCCYYPRPPLQHIWKQKKLKTKKLLHFFTFSLFTFTFHFHFSLTRSIAGIKERFERNSLKFDFLNFDPKNEIAFKFTRKSLLNAARARLARGFIKEIPFKIQHVQD